MKRAHELLARAPSLLLSATLDDALAERRRPNMPGTTDRPNWSLPLPVAVEDLPGHALLREVARTLADGVRATADPEEDAIGEQPGGEAREE